jgi:DNA-binding winged helix-turn-helix (wHTH) protein
MSISVSMPNVTVATQLPALVVNESSREVEVNGELIDLTRTEFDLLVIFARNPRRVLTPEVLLAWLWDSDCVPDSHPLEVYVHRLRAKLGESGRRPHFIHNVRGVGYRFEPQSITRECRAILEYDDRAVLRGIETNEEHLWGWEPHEVINSRFIPTRIAVLRNKRFINFLNRMCEAAGIESLNLTTRVVTKHGDSLAAKVNMRCRYEGSRLTGMSVDLTWRYQDIAETRSLT